MKISLDAAVDLLHEAPYGTIATVSLQMPGYPYATAVPYVPDQEHRPVVCISALAEHTRNLLADPRASLSAVQADGAHVQSAARITLLGDMERFEPVPELLARYLRYQPEAEQHLALDFMFFRLVPLKARFIGGIGKMGWLGNEDWQALPTIALEEEAALLKTASLEAPPGIRLVGVDCYGLDYDAGGRRQRQRFPDAPLPPERLAEVLPRLVAKLG